MRREREAAILLACARRFLGLASEEEILAGVRGGFDGSRLATLALREGMAGVVLRELDALEREHALGLPLTPLIKGLRGVFVVNGRLLSALEALREALLQQKLQTVVLKGAALLRTEYEGQLGLRPLSDVDLLVREDELRRFEALLREQGFRRSGESAGFFSSGEARIDLHTDLVGARRIPRRARAARFDLPGLWERSTPLGQLAGPFRALAPEDQFLHLAVHGQKHSFVRLIWLMDLALVSRRVSWPTLWSRAQETGTTRSLGYALRALAAVLGPVAPAAVHESLPPLNRLEKTFVHAVVARQPLEALGELVVIFSLDRPVDRLGYLFEYAFPGDARARSSFGEGYLRRVPRLLAGGVAEVSRMVRSSRF